MHHAALEREALGLPHRLTDQSPTPEVPGPKRPSWRLWLAVGVVGLLQLVLAISASAARNPDDIGYRVGYVTGSLVVWPAIIIGLFSLGRRFRNTRNRLIILLCTLVILRSSRLWVFYQGARR